MVRVLAEPLASAGWQLLVERRHYEFEAPPQLGAKFSTSLRLAQLHEPDDPRLAAVHREVMRGTLDAYDRAAIDRLGFDAACTESLAFLLDSDPVDSIHLGYDMDRPVGMVSGRVLSSGRGFVLFAGVAESYRGYGYGAELLAWMTRRLIGAGAVTLIADTDNDNVPMASAFARIGWPQTETRIDLVITGQPRPPGR